MDNTFDDVVPCTLGVSKTDKVTSTVLSPIVQNHGLWSSEKGCNSSIFFFNSEYNSSWYTKRLPGIFVRSPSTIAWLDLPWTIIKSNSLLSTLQIALK